MRLRPSAFALVFAILIAGPASGVLGAQDGPIRGGIELINVTATVTDDDGRFVPDLLQEDFAVFDDGQRQDIAYFAAERVPVSLGILLDVSGSMTEDKMASARSAIDRLISLLGPEDEVFFMQFSATSDLLQGWTREKTSILRAVRRATSTGGTAMYDALANALPIAGMGTNRKKALLVISDGNDTNSRLTLGQVRQMIRETEVLVYALGVDGSSTTRTVRPPTRTTPRFPFPIPVPGRPGGRVPFPFPQIVGGGQGRWPSPPGDRVNADALRSITDDSGGRTEVVRGFGDLDAATSRIADELSRQYTLGYVSPDRRDGRWHTIRVSVRGGSLLVRARRGYVAPG